MSHEPFEKREHAVAEITTGRGTGDGHSTDDRALQRSHVIAWRKEFQALTGLSPSDGDKVQEWQAAHGVPATGLVRRLTISAARAAAEEARSAGAANIPENKAHDAEVAGPRARPPVASTSEEIAAEHLVCLPEEGADSFMSLPEGSASAVPAVAPVATSPDARNANALGTAATTPMTAATSSNATAAKTAAAPEAVGDGLAGVKDNVTVSNSEMLHAEDIFLDVGVNTVSKKAAFNKLNAAWKQERHAEVALASAESPKARKTGEAALNKARQQVASATKALKDFIINARVGKVEKLKNMKKQLKQVNPKKDAGRYAKLDADIKAYEVELHKEIAPEVENMKSTEKGHENESVFQPQSTDVSHHDFVFPDGQQVRVRDHVVAYATTVSFGIDSEDPVDHADVNNVMNTAGLSSSRVKILQAISDFEGGFDSVNTYDRAKVTWGFVQWTGGSHSDLTQALTVIKNAYPKAFARSFQVYGIDVVKDQIVISMPDGTKPLVGEEAADAIMRNPKLAAALAHAGRDEDVKKGEVKAAVHIEIDAALSMSLHAGKGTAFTAAEVVTSEYGVGLLANTYVHSGSSAAKNLAQGALSRYVQDHPYKAGNAVWGAGAEAAVEHALAAADSDRAAKLKKILSNDRGSFQS